MNWDTTVVAAIASGLFGVISAFITAYFLNKRHRMKLETTSLSGVTDKVLGDNKKHIDKLYIRLSKNEKTIKSLFSDIEKLNKSLSSKDREINDLQSDLSIVQARNTTCLNRLERYDLSINQLFTFFSENYFDRLDMEKAEKDQLLRLFDLFRDSYKIDTQVFQSRFKALERETPCEREKGK